jgi:hypothetical protein
VIIHGNIFTMKQIYKKDALKNNFSNAKIKIQFINLSCWRNFLKKYVYRSKKMTKDGKIFWILFNYQHKLFQEDRLYMFLNIKMIKKGSIIMNNIYKLVFLLIEIK